MDVEGGEDKFMIYELIKYSRYVQCEFFEDYYTISYDGNSSKNEFNLLHWEDVTVEVLDRQDERYVQVVLRGRIDRREELLLATKNDARQIKNFYENRNDKRKNEKASISSYIDSSLLKIAENLINIVPEDVFIENEELIHLCRACEKKSVN